MSAGLGVWSVIKSSYQADAFARMWEIAFGAAAIDSSHEMFCKENSFEVQDFFSISIGRLNIRLMFNAYMICFS
jgi:hypothetical protein